MIKLQSFEITIVKRHVLCVLGVVTIVKRLVLCVLGVFKIVKDMSFAFWVVLKLLKDMSFAFLSHFLSAFSGEKEEAWFG